ncbi:MAG: orotate phosphoribosyltransferase [Verrucomicrobiota bacterium]
MDHQEEIISIFRETGALQEGHFVLRSGLHSGHFFQCAQVCQYLDKVTRLVELLIEGLGEIDCDTVVAPAMGGLVLGQEAARQLGKRFIFVEKEEGKLAMRRGFKLKTGEKVIIIEDVITRGGRVQETVDILEGMQANITKIGVLVDRSEGKASFSAPLTSLVQLSFPTYEADALPAELARVPVSKPGSK